MPTPNESIVRQAFEKHDRDIRIRDAIEQAWATCKERFPERAWWRRKTTTAAVMWEQSVANVWAALEGDVAARPIRHHDTASFVLDDIVMARLKRAGVDLFSKNYPTALASLFHKHNADLFGFEGHHRVEIVHVFNRFITELEWIGVVARDKNKVLWKFEFRSGGAAVVPFTPPAGTAPAADSVLRPTLPFGKDKTGKDKTDEEKK